MVRRCPTGAGWWWARLFRNLARTSLSWNGSTFTWALRIIRRREQSTIPLPAGNDSAVNLLATAVGGNQLNQTFVVTYTDGTTSSFTQSLSDWFTPQNYAGESKALTMPYRLLVIRSARQ